MTLDRLLSLAVAPRILGPVVALVGISLTTATLSPAEGAEGPGSASPAPWLPTALATAQVIFGADTVFAEVARTPDERAQGLMYREELAEDAGMLFIFPEAAVRGFWMQNTYLPLDIAFLDPSFRVVDIQQMEPLTTDQHTARAPFMYALEVNQGWFEAHGIGVGAEAEIVFGR